MAKIKARIRVSVKSHMSAVNDRRALDNKALDARVVVASTFGAWQRRPR